MDEMAFALDFEMPGHTQSELGRSRNTTSKKRERTQGTGAETQGAFRTSFNTIQQTSLSTCRSPHSVHSDRQAERSQATHTPKEHGF